MTSKRQSSTHSFLDAQEYEKTDFGGYTISGITEIPEYSALAVQLVHKKSGKCSIERYSVVGVQRLVIIILLTLCLSVGIIQCS